MTLQEIRWVLKGVNGEIDNLYKSIGRVSRSLSDNIDIYIHEADEIDDQGITNGITRLRELNDELENLLGLKQDYLAKERFLNPPTFSADDIPF